MKKIKFIISVFMLICVVMSSTVHAEDEYVNNAVNIEVLENSTKSFYELANEINALSIELDFDKLTEKMIALSEVMKSVPGNEIVDMILNGQSQDLLKWSLLEVCKYIEKDIDTEDIEYLLFEENVSYDVKQSLLTYLFKCSSNDELIEQVVLSGEERLAFHALKYLYQLEPQKAVNIADHIIDEFNGNVTFLDRAAIKIKALDLQIGANENDKIKFIEFCDDILNDDIIDDEIVIDAVGFALIDLHSE